MRYAGAPWRRWLAGLTVAALPVTVLVGVRPGVAASTAPGHQVVVSAVPAAATPSVRDGRVGTIYDAGQKIIAGGQFTRVRSHNATVDIPRAGIFAFDEATGVVDAAFAPVVDGSEITAVIGGPVAGTVYVAGRFTTVNGVNRSHVALLNVSTGSVVTGFAGPALNGAVTDLVLTGGRLLIGGNFTTAAGQPRGGLASLDPVTGALTGYLTVRLSGHHNWTPTSPPSYAQAPVGADKLAVSPDGSQLMVIGNFKQANAVTHDQAVKLTLGATTATVAAWNTTGYTPTCSAVSFDSYLRDVAYAPDGRYFVIVTSGGPHAGTLCDTAARWESAATGAALSPTWVAATGGDTLLSVAISEQVVYVGGHQRWLNNDLGADTARAGAVARPALAALDPANGVPTAWNPGRHPRGFGTTELYVTPQGLWIGYDQEWIGPTRYKRDRIAFFPLAGGVPLHSTTTARLPGTVYTLGQNPPTAVLYRVNAGGPTAVAADGGPDWAGDTQTAPSPRHNPGTAATAGLPTIATVPMPPVLAATPREIYSSERHGTSTAPNLLWDFPVPKGLSVQVRLYFASRCSCPPGSRTFHIAIDGVRKVSSYDITASVGNEVGTVRAFNITSDGNVDIDLLKVAGYPLVNAVEIARTVPPPLTGQENTVYAGGYDGNTTASPRTRLPVPTYTWYATRGGFWVGGTLIYGMTNNLYRRTFNGTTFGPAQLLDPYHSPTWDPVPTNSGPPGQTYTGVTTNFYTEIASITGMLYDRGRLYYTIAGHPTLYWRWFTPDSGIVAPVRHTVPSTINFDRSGGIFLSGNGHLYIVSRTTGNLTRVDWTNATPSGTPVIVSGPATGQDWRAKIVFVGPAL